MRDIKFRVWNNKTFRWVHGPDQISDLDGVNLFGETILLGEFLRGVAIEDYSELIALQYTGVNDRNNREVFEGDLVKAPAFHKNAGSVGQVVFRFGSFIVKTLDGTVFQDTYTALSDGEVVGNVFDNPSLFM